MKRFFTLVFICAGILSSGSASAQKGRIEEIFSHSDTSAIMDSLMKDFDAYLDSLIKQKSFFNVSAGFGTGFFSFKDNTALDYQIKNKAIFSPEVNYFHKSGLGLTLTGYLLKDKGSIIPYQYAVSPTYQYLKMDRFSTGISYTRFFKKDDLSFYTTPIKNEVYAYFNLKKWWIEPGLALSYGWGNKREFDQEEIEIYQKRYKTSRKKVIVIQTDESVRDFTALFSVRHSFKFDKLLFEKDRLTVRPVLLLSVGTQNFGFNTTFSSTTMQNNNILPVNSHITDVRGLEFQSATSVLQVDYSLGNMYIMPQLMMDYYLHAADKRFNSIASLTVGYNF